MSEGLVLLVVFLAMAAIWVGIMWAGSRIAGWSKLARFYTADQPMDGRRWPWQFIALRHYWGYGLVTVGANGQGIYLSLLALGGVQGHRPLFFPWTEVSVTVPDRMTFFYQAELRFSQVPDVPVRIRRSLFDKLCAVNPGREMGGFISSESPSPWPS